MHRVCRRLASRVTLAVSACVVMGAAAGACNSLSGIDDLVVVGDAGSDGAGPTGSSEASGEGGGMPGDAGASDADATIGSSDSAADGSGDSAADVGVGTQDDGSADGRTVSGDAPVDGAPDVTVEAAADGAFDGGSDAELEAGKEASTDAAPEASNCAVASPVCSGGCPIAHSDGLSQMFYDCVEAGTYNETQAFEACAAFTGDSGACANNPISCSQSNSVCSSRFTSCACWKYSGPQDVGKVLNTGTTSCSCVGTNGLPWY